MSTEIPSKIALNTHDQFAIYLEGLGTVDDSGYSLDQLGNDLITTLSHRGLCFISKVIDLWQRQLVEHIARAMSASDPTDYDRATRAAAPLVEQVSRQLGWLGQAMPDAWTINGLPAMEYWAKAHRQGRITDDTWEDFLTELATQARQEGIVQSWDEASPDNVTVPAQVMPSKRRPDPKMIWEGKYKLDDVPAAAVAIQFRYAFDCWSHNTLVLRRVA